MRNVATGSTARPWPKPFPSFRGYQFYGVDDAYNGKGLFVVLNEVLGHTVEISPAGPSPQICNIAYDVKSTLMEVPDSAYEESKGRVGNYQIQSCTGKAHLDSRAIKADTVRIKTMHLPNEELTNNSGMSCMYPHQARIHACDTVWRQFVEVAGQWEVEDAFFFRVQDGGAQLCPLMFPPSNEAVEREKMRHAFKMLQNANVHKTGDRQQLQCDVAWRNLTQIQTVNEQFSASVQLTFSWLASREDVFLQMFEPSTFQPTWQLPELVIENQGGDGATLNRGRPQLMRRASGIYIEQEVYIYGCFSEPFELASFPFDVQPLQIKLRTEDFNGKGTDYKSGKIRFQPNFLNVSEWRQCKEKALELRLAPDMELVIETSLVLSRNPFIFVVRIVVVMTVVAALSLCIFQLHVKEDLADRMSNAATLLLTAVAYSLVVGSSLPVLGYLTFLDKHVLTVLAFLAIVITQIGILGGLDVEEAEKWDDICLKFNQAFIIILTLVTSVYCACKTCRQATGPKVEEEVEEKDEEEKKEEEEEEKEKDNKNLEIIHVAPQRGKQSQILPVQT